MEAWTAVTFTTPEYEHFAPRWEEMIRSLGGTPIVTRMSSTGDWARNTGLKPAAILDAWRHLTTAWFLYLDIDILLREAPAAPTGTWDVGIVENRDMSHKNRISAGSLIFHKTEGGLRFLQQWNARCRQRPGKDHDNMAKTISLAKATRRPLIQDITGAIDWVPNGLKEDTLTINEGIPEPVPPLEGSPVWFVIPCVRPKAETMEVLGKWMSAGYKVAVQRDPGAEGLPVDLCITRPYQGYAEAVNYLTNLVLTTDPTVRWVVTGGDDVLPDPTRPPSLIAAECEAHFGGTLGVMQPTGDRHLVDRSGRSSAERLCTYPWMGREWCERAYEGKGPLHQGYFHCFVDAEMQEVVVAAGLLWHRKDLTQYHDWRGRSGGSRAKVTENGGKWEKDKRLFNQRKRTGFPGSTLAGKPKKEPIYFGYYTPGPYEADYQALAESLNALKLPHDFIRLDSQGPWQEITQRKALIVKDALHRHAGHPLVYLDVDCIVIKPPILFYTLDCDIAASMFDNELLSGTVYFGNTPSSHAVVDRWIALNEKYPVTLPNGLEAWDQRTLKMATREVACKFSELPPAYTYMVGLSQIKYPDVHPVILHTRGSLRHNPEHI